MAYADCRFLAFESNVARLFQDCAIYGIFFSQLQNKCAEKAKRVFRLEALGKNLASTAFPIYKAIGPGTFHAPSSNG
jgi:hypothetical protein